MEVLPPQLEWLILFPTSKSNYSDASGTFGCGAVADDIGWFQAQWPGGWEDIDIAVKVLVPIAAVKVLVPIAASAGLWGRQWTGQHVCFHSDNMAVVAFLTTEQQRLHC